MRDFKRDMRNYIKNIVAILMLVVLLPASSGIPIFHHICGFDGSHITSIFTSQKCEHEHGIESKCSECANETETQDQCTIDEDCINNNSV